jgi:hypothetical protein
MFAIGTFCRDCDRAVWWQTTHVADAAPAHIDAGLCADCYVERLRPSRKPFDTLDAAVAAVRLLKQLD